MDYSGNSALVAVFEYQSAGEQVVHKVCSSCFHHCCVVYGDSGEEVVDSLGVSWKRLKQERLATEL